MTLLFSTLSFRFAIRTFLAITMLYLAAPAVPGQTIPLGLAGTRSQPPAPPSGSPAMTTSFRGRADLVLAQSRWGALTERDLFLYLLMNRQAGSWKTVANYHEAREAGSPGLAKLRRSVMATIRGWALTQHLAEQAPPPPGPSDELWALRHRIATYPIHELVWIDHFIVPQVQVLPEDVRKYYQENESEFLTPEKVQVRYIFIAAPEDKNAASPLGSSFGEMGPFRTAPSPREEARSRLNNVLNRILLENADFSEMARQYSEAPSASEGGLIPAFPRGTLFEAFEEEAFSLEPGGLSPVIEGPEGFYLLQGVRNDPPTVRPLEEVAGEIRDWLYFLQIQKRYLYHRTKLVRENPPSHHIPFFKDLEPGAMLYEAGSLKIRKEQAWELFPQFASQGFQMDMKLMAYQLVSYGYFEVIAQANESSSWADDGRLEWASAMATKLLQANDEADRLVEPQLLVNENDVTQFLQAEPAVAKVVTPPGFSFVQFKLLEPDRYSEARNQWMLERLRQAMLDLRDRLEGQSLTQIVEEWDVPETDPALIVPMMLERTLMQIADDTVAIRRWHSSDLLTKLDDDTEELVEQARQLFQDTKDMGRPRFGPPIRQGYRVTLFYFETPDYTQPAIIRQNFEQARQRVNRTIKLRFLARLQNQLVQDGLVEYQLP